MGSDGGVVIGDAGIEGVAYDGDVETSFVIGNKLKLAN